MKYCNKCGFKLEQNVKYCSKCGSKIRIDNYEDVNSHFNNDGESDSSTDGEYIESNHFSNDSGNTVKQGNDYSRIYALYDKIFTKQFGMKLISFLRYFFGIVILLSGIFNLSLIYILVGISLMPITYEFILVRLDLEARGKKFLKVISVILPIVLLLTAPSEVPSDIQIINSKNSILIGEIIELSVKTDIEGYDTSRFSWKSSDVNVATVKNGRLTGISEGTSVISVESDNGLKSEFTISVKFAP